MRRHDPLGAFPHAVDDAGGGRMMPAIRASGGPMYRIFVLVVALIAACGPAAAPSPSSTAVASAVPTATPASAPVTVKFGQVGTISDAAIFIADAKGYFKEQGIALDLQTFQSAANMTTPLGTGELDAGGGAPSAGLFNAIGRGVNIRIERLEVEGDALLLE